MTEIIKETISLLSSLFQGKATADVHLWTRNTVTPDIPLSSSCVFDQRANMPVLHTKCYQIPSLLKPILCLPIFSQDI